MDGERALLSKAVQTGQVDRLIRKGIDETYFYSDDCKDVWRTCVTHLSRFRSTPSFDAVRKTHPEFSFEIVTDAFDYVLEEFVKQTKRRATIEGLRDLAKAVDDPSRILDIESDVLELGSHLAKLFPSGHASRFSQMEERIAEYEQRVKEGRVKGIPVGIHEIDDVMNGIRPHEFVSVVGWQGLGKSTLTQHICFAAYLAGFTPMVISLEMEASEMFARFDNMATNFSSRALQKLELGEGDMKRWAEWAERAKTLTNDIIVVDNVSNCTVEKVHAMLQQYSPDLAVVDYVSLMEAPKGYGQIWEKVTHLTQSLKQMARDPDNPPIIGVAQTNIGSADDGAKLENIAYSRSIGQDSDLVFGLHQDDKMKARYEMEVRVLKNRRGATVNAKMYWNPEKMEFRRWEISDMFASPSEDGDNVE
jgi:replicative DNA helicase